MATQNKRQIQAKNKKLEKVFNKYFKLRYLLLGIISLILISVYTEFFKVLILITLFIPLVAYSMMAGKMVPHINVELLAPCVLLLGYLYGPLVPVVFGPIAGFYGMFKSGHIRFLMIVRIVVCSIVASVMSFFTNLSFNANFIIGILVMNVILFFIYLVLDPDPIQNYTHRMSHLLSNIVIIRYLFLALYKLLILI